MGQRILDRPLGSLPGFTLEFGGDPHDVSASTFLPCLLSVAGIVEELNGELGKGERVELRIRVPQPGSFLVDLLFGPAAVGPAVGLFTGDTFKLATTIISTLSNLLNIRKHLKKDPPKQVEGRTDSIVVHNSQGSTMLVDQRVFNIYATNTTVTQQLDRAFQALDADPSVTSFEMRDASNMPVFTATRNEFSELSAGASVRNEAEQRVVQQVQLSIVKVSFDRKLRWELIFAGNRIGAYIVDEEFWAAVDRRDETFAKGDLLDVDLQIDQLWDQGLKTFINRAYRVIKVRGHIRQGKQGDLFAGEPG